MVAKGIFRRARGSRGASSGFSEYNSPNMQPDSLAATELRPAGMGEFSRITGVFFEPGKTFADIAARPRWLPPLALILIVSMAFMIVYSQRGGWLVMMQQQIANSPRTAQMTPEQRDQAIEMGVKYASLAAYVTPILIPVSFLIVAGVLTLITAGILSAPVKFSQVFAIVCYANLTGVVKGLLLLAVLLMKNISDFDIKNPFMSNPGYFMDPKTGSKFLYSLAGSVDLFSLWIVFLIAVGLKAAAGKKLSFGGAFFAVALPWAVWVLGAAALAGIFS
jgi:hypothetical protein